MGVAALVGVRSWAGARGLAMGLMGMRAGEIDEMGLGEFWELMGAMGEVAGARAMVMAAGVMGAMEEMGLMKRLTNIEHRTPNEE